MQDVCSNIFFLPVMPAQISGRCNLPKSRFAFIKDVNIQNSLLWFTSYILIIECKKYFFLGFSLVYYQNGNDFSFFQIALFQVLLLTLPMVLAEPESRPGPLPGPHARPGPLPGPHARPGPRPGPAVQSHVVPKDPFTGPPKPYAFKYGVADVKTGSNFDHAQQQEASGVVRGKM
jgi:hypothetical protein